MRFLNLELIRSMGEFMKEANDTSTAAWTQQITSRTSNKSGHYQQQAWKLPEECKSHDNFTVASTQQTTSRTSNKAGNYQQQAWELPEECKSHDNFTAALIQQTTHMFSNKWREPLMEGIFASQGMLQ